MHTSLVSIVKCPDYEPSGIQQALGQAVEMAGGINLFVKPGQRVLVKPNLLMAAAPEAGITTHPEVVRAAIRLLKKAGAMVFVGDEPSTWNHHKENVDYVYEATGIRAVCEQEGASLIKFEKKNWRGNFPLYSWAEEADVIVNVPKFKTHQLTTLTAAVKNLYGFVAGTYKAELHKQYFKPLEFSRAVVDILERVRPALTIVDAVVAMEGDGPATGGKLRNAGLILCGTDCLAVDAVLAHLMGLKPDAVFFIKEAARRGLGTADIKAIKICGEPLESAVLKDFLLPTAFVGSKWPAFLVQIFRRLVRLKPQVLRRSCIRCGSCIRACPKKAISLRRGKVYIAYRGCISCFCCQEVCPAAAIKVKKSFLARMMGL